MTMKTHIYVVNPETGTIKVTAPDGTSGSLLFNTSIREAKNQFTRIGIALRSLSWFKSKKIWFHASAAEII